jgi:hypothetical protein
MKSPRGAFRKTRSASPKCQLRPAESGYLAVRRALSCPNAGRRPKTLLPGREAVVHHAPPSPIRRENNPRYSPEFVRAPALVRRSKYLTGPTACQVESVVETPVHVLGGCPTRVAPESIGAAVRLGPGRRDIEQTRASHGHRTKRPASPAVRDPARCLAWNPATIFP